MSQKNKIDWLNSYYSLYKESIFDESNFNKIIELAELWEKIANKIKERLSSLEMEEAPVMASHCAVDFTKKCKCKSDKFQ